MVFEEHEITSCAMLDIERYNTLLHVITSKYLNNNNVQKNFSIYYQKCVYFDLYTKNCIRVICTSVNPICPVAFSDYSGPYIYKFDEKIKQKYKKYVVPISVNDIKRIMFINCTVKNSTESILHKSGIFNGFFKI